MTVDHIGISGGGPEGENSAYVFPERGLVVDPGPPAESAWTRLLDGLDRAGCPPTAVTDVVVTHWHIDHAGLAPRLAERGGATIHMHERDAPFVRRYETVHRARRERDQTRLRRWGVPEDLRHEVRAADTPSPLPEETPVASLTDGDTVAGLTVHHTPGHTAGHIILNGDDELLVGDTVLGTYTPNIGGSDTRLLNALSAYHRSLKKVSALPGRLRPGHGESVDRDRLTTIRRHHGTRAERVRSTVDDLNGATPWTVASEMFGEMAGVHAKFGAGEAATHLRRLTASGVLRRTDTDPLTYRTEG